MKDDKLYYYGTDIDVRLGDRVIYKAWGIFSKPGIVVYVPGQSKIHKTIGDDQWVIELNDTKNLATMGFFPHYDMYTFKIIKFISRGITDSIQEDEEIN